MIPLYLLWATWMVMAVERNNWYYLPAVATCVACAILQTPRRR